MAAPRTIHPLPRRRRSQVNPERPNSSHPILHNQNRNAVSHGLPSAMAEDSKAFFNPLSTAPTRQPEKRGHKTQLEVNLIRQRRQRITREHSGRAFANPGIPAIGEESEDDLSMGIPYTESSRLGSRKRRATDTPGESATPATTVDGAASTPSAKRPRTSGPASTPGRSFSESLALMPPSPKKMEALEYKATLKRRETQRSAIIKRVGDMFSGDGHLSRWLDDLRTSALRRPSQSLRSEIKSLSLHGCTGNMLISLDGFPTNKQTVTMHRDCCFFTKFIPMTQHRRSRQRSGIMEDLKDN